MPFGPYDLLTDFALMSGLLFVAQILRTRVRWIQNLFMPAAIIAGALGFLLSESTLSAIDPDLGRFALPFSQEIAAYPYLLVVVLFASLYIGNRGNTSITSTFRRVGDTFSVNLAAELGGFGLALLVGGGMLLLFVPDTESSLAILQPAGFIGGHGYAAAIGTTLEIAPQSPWLPSEAVMVGQTFATVGILSGIIGGLFAINIGARKRYTRLTAAVAELPADARLGFIEPENQKPLGKITVNPMTLDPVTWHVLLILIASAGGYYSYHALRDVIPGLVLPMMCLSMLCGVGLQKTIVAVGLEHSVDRQVVTRIGSSVTDFLVAFGIASIKVSVIAKFAIPILLLCILGVAYSFFFLFFISKRVFRNYWFERGIFVFGWTTGVVAMGVTLLRIVDPDFRSKVLDDYGIAYVFISMIELILISVLPSIVALGYLSGSSLYTLLPGGALILVSCALLALTVKRYGLQSRDGTTARADEHNVHVDGRR